MTADDPTQNIFFALDSWVFDLESQGVPLVEIIDILQEYTEIMIDLNDDAG